MSVISGRYVRTFLEADMGMLNGASLNAPYEFHWLYITEVVGEEVVCRTGDEGRGREMRLPYRATRQGDRAEVTLLDPIFGPLVFEVHPFRRNTRT